MVVTSRERLAGGDEYDFFQPVDSMEQLLLAAAFPDDNKPLVGSESLPTQLLVKGQLHEGEFGAVAIGKPSERKSFLAFRTIERKCFVLVGESWRILVPDRLVFQPPPIFG